MKVSYINGIPQNITIDNVTYQFKRFKSERNTWCYSVIIDRKDYTHDSSYSVAVFINDEIEEIYNSKERGLKDRFTGDSELFECPSWSLRRR
jgi:hypothetical protein